MNVILRMIDGIDDRMNPIVVRELRQSVSGRMLPSVVLLFLAVQLFVLGWYMYASSARSLDTEAGQEAFMTMNGILLFTSLLFIPGYTASRMATERTGNNVDLLYITTISPRAILWGKLLTSLLLGLVVFSTSTPFMTITYLMRGIDLPTIFVILVYDYLVLAGAVMAATFIACLPTHMLFKILLWMGLGGSVMGAFVGSMELTNELLRFGLVNIFSNPEAWIATSVSVGVGLIAWGFLFVLSMSMISPGSSNRALPVRIYVTACWIISGATAMGLSLHFTFNMPIFIWAGGAMSVLGAMFVGSVCERTKPGPRVASRIPRFWPLRVFAFLFYSGAAGGIIWSLSLIAATLVIANVWIATFPSARHTFWRVDDGIGPFTLVCSSLAFYLIAYMLTAETLRRTLIARWVTSNYNWVIGGLMLAVGCLLPTIGLLMMNQDISRPSNLAPSLLIPFMVFEHIDREELLGTYLVFSMIWAGGMVLVNLPWLKAQIWNFKPLNKKAAIVAGMPQVDGADEA